MKKFLIVSILIILALIYLGTTNLLHDTRMEPELKNSLILQSALNDVSIQYSVKGNLRHDILDAYGQALTIEVKGQVLTIRSAGKDRTFHTDDDQIKETEI